MIWYWLTGIAGVVLLGLVALEDLHTGRIRNVWAVFGAAAGVMIQAASAVGGASGLDNALNAGLAALLGAAAGYLLWHFSVWSAGDGKILPAAILLVPPGVFGGGVLRPVLALLFCTAVFMLAFSAASLLRELPSFVSGARGLLRPDALKKAFSALLAVAVLACIGNAVSAGLRGAAGAAGLTGDWVYIAIFLMARRGAVLFRSRLAIAAGIVCIAGVVICRVAAEGAAGARSIVVMSGWSLAVLLFRYVYDAAMAGRDSEVVPPSGIRQGMAPAAGEIESLGLGEIVGGSDAGEVLPDGLTAMQASAISSELSRRGLPGLRIQRTVPFAPFIFFGYMLMLAVSRPQ